MMLNQKRSTRWSQWKYALVFPLLFVALGIFSCAKEDGSSAAAKTEKVMVEVDQMPEFPEGEQALLMYIYSNIKYPKAARDEGIEGRVTINFVIDKNGNIKDAKIKEDIGGGCGEEALRVIQSMPKWNPGQHQGKTVAVEYTLPIRYKLE